jgi:site-specific DNA recombinase
MNKPLRAALYARVSSQKQANEATIRSQLHALQQRIARDGLSVAKKFQFCDDGYSGSQLQRPALEALRDHVACGMFDRLYVHSPDRLARNFAHQAILLEEFQRHGCEILFLDQEGLPGTAESNLLVQLQGMIAEYEREKILERTRRGRRHAAFAGSVSVFSGAPYGYRYISKRDGGGHARWEIDPEECVHVRCLFELVGVYGKSLGAVARELTRRGVPTRRGKARWDRTTIRGILRNPAYHGQARYGKVRFIPRNPRKRSKRGDPPVPRRAQGTVATKENEQIMIAVPAIVDKSLFDEVGKRMEENRRRQREHQSGAKSLLSGLTICGLCGSAYCGRRHGSRAYFYYRCIRADHHRTGGQPACENRSVKGHELEHVVWNELCKLLSDPSKLVDELQRRRSREAESHGDLDQLKQRVDLLRNQLDRLIDAYTQSLIEADEFQSRIEPLRERHAQEQAALENLQGAVAEPDAAAAALTLQRLSEEVADQLADASDTLKRDLLQLLIERIEIHESEIRIVYKVPHPPFATGPARRGFLQHCWRRQHDSPGQSAAPSWGTMPPRQSPP